MAHFLVDASLPRATATLIGWRGHQATDVRDIGLGDSPDTVIAEHARTHGLALISRDQDFANLLDYPPEKYSGIVVLETPPHASRGFVLGMVEAFMADPLVISQLPGRLAIVEPGRIRLRPQ